MIETFDSEEFLAVLHQINPRAEIRGVDKGEVVFIVPLDAQAQIVVRSSIRPDGMSAEVGEDSIRFWLTDNQGAFLGKLDTYTTRVPGWSNRMKLKIMYLSELRKKAGDCRSCDKPKHLFVSTKDISKGRIFAKCPSCGVGFAWMDQPTEPYFAREKLPSVLTDPEPEPESAPEPRFSSEQEPAIVAPFVPVRVLAGPGSGKTFTIKYRYAYMLKNGFKPEDIVAVTFNVKMASELYSKIVSVCPSVEGSRGGQQICSIHALCFRSLSAFYPQWKGRELVKEWQVKKLIGEVLVEHFYDPEDRPAYEETMAVINSSKFHGFSTENCGAFFVNIGLEDYAEFLVAARERLDGFLEAKRLMTFPDQLLHMELSLNNDPGFLSWCNSRYKAVIIDEGQDTSGQAMRILSKLADHTRNIFIVGDTDQLLYRFTGATPEANLAEGFEERYPEGLTFKLGTNYRSTQKIVEKSRYLIAKNYAPEGPYDQKYLKGLTAHTGASEGVEFLVKSYANPILEAKGILESIQELIVEGKDPGEIFVGFRTRAQGGYLESVFARAVPAVPFINTTGMSFWGLGHVQDCVAYLTLTQYPDDAKSFDRVFNLPSAGFTNPWRPSAGRPNPEYGKYCGHRFLGQAFLQDSEHSMRNVMTLARRRLGYAPGAEDFYYMVKDMARQPSISEMVIWFIDNCYRRYLQFEMGGADNNVGEGGKLDDLAAVAEIASEYESLPDFLDYVKSMISAAEAQKENDWSGKVVLSTIHRLKGLERPIVFGAGIAEGIPVQGKITGLLPHTFAMIEPPNDGKFPVSGKGRVEDERCLFYVLITRAKERVYLTYPLFYRKSPMQASRFLGEL